MRRYFIALVLAVGVFVQATSASAASITFDSKNVNLGDCATLDCSFDIDVEGAGFEPFNGLVLNFTFDSTVLTLASIAQGEFLAKGGTAGFMTDPLPGAVFQTITMFVDFGIEPLAGSGTLATLTFVPKGPAGSDVVKLLAEGILDPETSVPTEYYTADERVLIPTLESGIINIETPTTPQPVPEPSTLALLGLGLTAMARKRLKRKTLAPSVN